MDLDLAESLVSGRFSEVLTDSKDSCESDAGLKSFIHLIETMRVHSIKEG